MIKFAVFALLATSAFAAPESRYPPRYPPAEEPTTTLEPCPEGQDRDALDECVELEILRNLFVFKEPTEPPKDDSDVTVPPPQLKLNLLVIKTADEVTEEPIVIPPPREKTLVLVLSKKGSDERQIIEVPAPDAEEPEVFFVDYIEGENPLLPGNIYLEDALKYAEEQETPTEEGAGYQ